MRAVCRIVSQSLDERDTQLLRDDLSTMMNECPALGAKPSPHIAPEARQTTPSLGDDHPTMLRGEPAAPDRQPEMVRRSSPMISVMGSRKSRWSADRLVGSARRHCVEIVQGTSAGHPERTRSSPDTSGVTLAPIITRVRANDLRVRAAQLPRDDHPMMSATMRAAGQDRPPTDHA
jgi:hypothetical protein